MEIIFFILMAPIKIWKRMLILKTMKRKKKKLKDFLVYNFFISIKGRIFVLLNLKTKTNMKNSEKVNFENDNLAQVQGYSNFESAPKGDSTNDVIDHINDKLNSFIRRSYLYDLL